LNLYWASVVRLLCVLFKGTYYNSETGEERVVYPRVQTKLEYRLSEENKNSEYTYTHLTTTHACYTQEQF